MDQVGRGLRMEVWEMANYVFTFHNDVLEVLATLFWKTLEIRV